MLDFEFPPCVTLDDLERVHEQVWTGWDSCSILPVAGMLVDHVLHISYGWYLLYLVAYLLSACVGANIFPTGAVVIFKSIAPSGVTSVKIHHDATQYMISCHMLDILQVFDENLALSSCFFRRGLWQLYFSDDSQLGSHGIGADDRLMEACDALNDGAGREDSS